ncbi:MAG: hypothetical protein ACLP1Q_19225 [Solirubrobacteraceae bacterium]
MVRVGNRLRYIRPRRCEHRQHREGDNADERRTPEREMVMPVGRRKHGSAADYHSARRPCDE